MFTISFVTDSSYARVANMTCPDRDIAKRALEALCSQEGSSVTGGLLWEGAWATPDSRPVETYHELRGWSSYHSERFP